jgi:hypothetical protein
MAYGRGKHSDTLVSVIGNGERRSELYCGKLVQWTCEMLRNSQWECAGTRFSALRNQTPCRRSMWGGSTVTVRVRAKSSTLRVPVPVPSRMSLFCTRYGISPHQQVGLSPVGTPRLRPHRWCPTDTDCRHMKYVCWRGGFEIRRGQIR